MISWSCWITESCDRPGSRLQVTCVSSPSEPTALYNLLEIAITNLADHSEAVLAAHGCPSQRSKVLWTNWHTLPIPYPNIITLGTQRDESALNREIDEFMKIRPEGVGTGINDSFSHLHLERHGMKQLLSNSWAVRDPAAVTVDVPEGLDIVPVESVDLLHEFDRAISSGFGSSDAVRVYIDPLLEDARFTIKMGLSEGRVVTGVMAFNNGVSVGIYALATLPEARNKGFGEAIVRSVLAEAAHLPAMTNPSSMSASLFSRLGFNKYGTRTVWVTA